MSSSIIATGFGPYPGAPENPTEWLMRLFAVDAPVCGDDVRFQSFVLPTEYDGLQERIALIGNITAPDIAIHFGLSRQAQGFRLERLARNHVATDRVDAKGDRPASAALAPGLGDIASSLPLERCAAALTAAGIPAAMSDDCGDYLCNALFFHSCGKLVTEFQPCWAGFVHVPLPGSHFSEDMLARGARIIIAETYAAWRERAVSACSLHGR